MTEKSRNPLIPILAVWGLYLQWLFFFLFSVFHLAFHLSVRSFNQCCYSTMKGVTLCLMLHLVSRRSAQILFTTTVGCSFQLYDVLQQINNKPLLTYPAWSADDRNISLSQRSTVVWLLLITANNCAVILAYLKAPENISYLKCSSITLNIHHEMCNNQS